MQPKLFLPFLLTLLVIGCSQDQSSALSQEASNGYLVTLTDGTNPEAFLAEYQIVPEFIYQHALVGFAASVPGSALAELKQDARVELIEPDRVGSGPAVASGMTINWNQNQAPWGLDRIDQESLPLDGKYSYWPTGKGVNVYIVSSGISKTHQDIQGRVYSGRDFVGDSWGTNDCYGEGTASASIIGGKTFGVAGVLA